MSNPVAVQVTIIGRSKEDEVLLLASDGLWDVLTNQEAVNLAQRCLRRARERGASRQAATRVAASVLTRAALDEGSSDNVTVVVIDLSQCVTPPPSCSHICDGGVPILTSAGEFRPERVVVSLCLVRC